MGCKDECASISVPILKNKDECAIISELFGCNEVKLVVMNKHTKNTAATSDTEAQVLLAKPVDQLEHQFPALALALPPSLHCPCRPGHSRAYHVSFQPASWRGQKKLKCANAMCVSRKKSVTHVPKRSNFVKTHKKRVCFKTCKVKV